MSEGEAERLAKQLGLSRARCLEALAEAAGDPERAMRALLRTGEVDPTRLDPEALPNWAFTEAQLARTRSMMGDMAIPTELQAFFEATLGQVGVEERRRAGLRSEPHPDASEEDAAHAGRRLKDLEFGELEWRDGAWWGKAPLAGFYGPVPLAVEAPGGAPPDDIQRVAHRSLKALDEGFRAVLQALLVGFYEGLRTSRPDRLEALGDPTDIWQVLDGPVVHLARQDLGEQLVVLRFRRAGGGARRIDVRMRGGRLAGVGLT